MSHAYRKWECRYRTITDFLFSFSFFGGNRTWIVLSVAASKLKSYISSTAMCCGPFLHRKGRDVSYDAPVVKAHQFPQHFEFNAVGCKTWTVRSKLWITVPALVLNLSGGAGTVWLNVGSFNHMQESITASIHAVIPAPSIVCRLPIKEKKRERTCRHAIESFTITVSHQTGLFIVQFGL